ncbi:MAG TPA: hypothetical protein VK021_05840 [Flavobacteriaceae bacterium]|nr:hypothetical protein [Flavobacteriaceae bacterium]
MKEESQYTDQGSETRYVHINPAQPQNNTMGITGFILALVALFIGWIPILGWMVWVLGLIFSIVGLTKEPKGFAIAGLIISFLGIILLIILFMGILSLGFLSGL